MTGAPPDRTVRGRTRAGRLDGLDAWLVHEARELLFAGGLVVDVGFGATTVTLEALAVAVHQVDPRLEVVGLERDASRAGARAVGARLVVGGFEALSQLSGAVVVRAMNVLRGYRAEEAPLIHRALGVGLIEGGLLLEGSTDTEGHVSVCHLARRRGGELTSEGLLLYTDFERGFSPWLFRDWLPSDLRRAVRPGTRIHGLLDRWSRAVQAGGSGRSPRERFSSSVGQVDGLAATPWELAHGYVRALDVLET